MICCQVSSHEMCRQGAVPSVTWFVVADTPFVTSDFLVGGTTWTRCFYLKHRENIQNLSMLKRIFVFYGSFQLCRGLEKMTFAQKWPRGRRNKSIDKAITNTVAHKPEKRKDDLSKGFSLQNSNYILLSKSSQTPSYYFNKYSRIENSCSLSLKSSSESHRSAVLENGFLVDWWPDSVFYPCFVLELKGRKLQRFISNSSLLSDGFIRLSSQLGKSP